MTASALSSRDANLAMARTSVPPAVHTWSYHTYSERRTTYIHQYETPRTMVIYHAMPRSTFGFWDGVFLATMLEHITEPSYASWAYAHQNDPGYQQWHQDAMQLAEQNGEMRQQMAQLNSQMAQMQQQGVTPQNPSILPAGVDPSVAMAPSAARDIADGREKERRGLTVGSVFEAGFFLLLAGLVGAVILRKVRAKSARRRLNSW